MDAYRNLIASRIKSVRKSKGQTQAALAEALGCETNTVSRWERGEFSPSIDQFLNIAEALGVSPMDILPGKRDIEMQNISSLKASLGELIFLTNDEKTLSEILISAQLITAKNAQ